MEKLEWCDYPVSEEILKICLFVSPEHTNVTDRHMDRQTQHDGTGHVYASCGKNNKLEK